MVPPEEEALTPEQRFRRGKRLFEYRDCPGAISTLADLAIPGLLDDESQQLEVHRMLGICYALDNNRREAAREFSSLLSLDPDHQLDPFEVPPPVVELFETQKQAMKVRLDELRRARERAREELPDDGAVLIERTRTVRSTPFATVFLPFGLAQVANGDLVTGGILGAVQGAGLLANVVGYWVTIGIETQGDADGINEEEASLHNAFRVTHWAGLGLLVVGYGVGVAEALWNREDQAVMAEKATRRPLTSAEMKKLRRIERAPTPPSTTESTPAEAGRRAPSRSPTGEPSTTSP